MGAADWTKNPELIGQAFALYCGGLSLGKVIDTLKPEWPEVTESTLRRVAVAYGWQKARAVMIEQAMKRRAEWDDAPGDIVMQLSQLKRQLEGQRAARQLTVPAGQLYLRVCEDIMWYTGKHPKLAAQSPIAVCDDPEVTVLLGVLHKHPLIGAMLEKHREQIRASVESELEKLRRRTERARVAGKARAAGAKTGKLGKPGEGTVKAR